jgi:uncharacterized membrane protein HdeD (DUF308 family)
VPSEKDKSKEQKAAAFAGIRRRGIKMEVDRTSDKVVRSIHDYWTLFLFEGAALLLLGLLAVVIPSIASSAATLFIGWLFIISGVIGLVTTFWARPIPGFWWSLVSALLGVLVGAVLVAHRSNDLYGGLMGWPLEAAGPLRMVLVLFFLIEGGASIMFAFEHRRQFSGRWAWMLASGILDIGLATVIIFDLPGTSAWTMGLLIGINMIVGGASLIAMGLHARSGSPASNAALQ